MRASPEAPDGTWGLVRRGVQGGGAGQLEVPL